MNRSVRRVAFVLLAISIAVMALLSVRDRGEELGPGDSVAASRNVPASRRTAIVTAAERVSPSVVSVSVIKSRVVKRDPAGFWERFYPPAEDREEIPGLGSGFIVDAGGLVLTNEHVVRNAERVAVTLADGRQLPAEVVGASTTYDLAVLRVGGNDLREAPLGDSDQMAVGEWAIAIGSPFGYLLNDTQPTITAGVISAVRRDIKTDATESGVYKNMIQTDAAINPGNSGGPLVNADGEVIGVNTFLFTSTGGSMGIGFAIPINLAREVIEEIETFGRVRTAWIGMRVQPVTPHIAERLGFTEVSGLVVTSIDPSGPAAEAGLQVTDRIVEVNGLKIRTVEDAQRGIYGARVGDTLRLSVERDGGTLTVDMTLRELPAQ